MTADAPKPDFAEFESFYRDLLAPRGQNRLFIPLHDFSHVDESGRQRGKSPLHRDWLRRDYRDFRPDVHMFSGGNVGLRVPATMLVVDVDPRAFEEDPLTGERDDPLRRLCEDTGLDPDLCPTVTTGSGGTHLYLSKPADLPVRDSLKEYLGVEFKSHGRQVVAAGSVHPATLRRYVGDPLAGSFPAPQAPERLLNLIRRPSVTNAANAGGEFTPEQLGAMLDGLDPRAFKGGGPGGRWYELMCACHHATAGEGRQEFVEWSTRDPEYAGQGAEVGRRWDSLHSGRPDAITYRTLLKVLHDAGRADLIPREPAAEDFEGIEDDDREVPEYEKKGALERLNDVYWAVNEGGQFRIIYEELDRAFDPPRRFWARMSRWDFENIYCNRSVTRGEKQVPLGRAWIEWPRRREARGVVFDPKGDPGPDILNLWTGWAVEPRKGDWSLLQELLYDGLCDRDDGVYGYVLDWAAFMVQHPNKPAEVAVCFQGGMGVGKGTWGRALVALAGRHGMQITSTQHLTGRFNEHLRDCIVLFADEAIKPHDKEAESVLKGLLTEPVLMYEGKGQKATPGRNHLHVLMASNDDWFVPMSLHDDRRFMVQRCSERFRGRHSFFEALNLQLYGDPDAPQEERNRGLAALLFDLLQRDIRGWAPRTRIPVTRASAEQKIRNMTPIGQWWYSVLREGVLPFEPAPRPERGPNADRPYGWPDHPVRVFVGDLRGAFADWCGRERIARPGGSGRAVDHFFTAELGKLVSGMDPRVRARVPDDRVDIQPHSDGCAWAVELPSLAQCRASLDRVVGYDLEWG